MDWKINNNTNLQIQYVNRHTTHFLKYMVKKQKDLKYKIIINQNLSN